MDADLRMAVRIAREVDRASGCTYLVGGYVRDRLLGLENKDIDLEVHGISVEALEKILDSLGERLSMGASFGVMGLRGTHLDIAMPRAEKATGRGHRDFAVSVDPFLGEKKAASRRDFTMNALMQNVLTGEILDFFGGREDIRQGLIRHVSADSFAEDPLRVLRAAQFSARFGFQVAASTEALCANMDLKPLAGERVMGELEKALLKAERPSVFFEELRSMHQLSVWFPELEALIGVPQQAEHHPEGDVWRHTMQVLDEAARLRPQSEYPLGLMLAALCHDLGKAGTTQRINGKLHAYGHEQAGLAPAMRLVTRLTGDNRLAAFVRDMTRLHMLPNRLAAEASGPKSFMRMFDGSAWPEELLLLAKADSLGCRAPGADRAALLAAYAPKEERLKEMLAVYRERMAQPYVRGRDLIEAGCAPGEDFGEALRFAHKLRLAGIGKQQQLAQTLAFLRKQRKTQEKQKEL